MAFARSLGSRTVLAATTAGITAWFDRDRPVGPDSRVIYLARLHRFFTWLAEDGLIETIPTTDLHRFLVPQCTAPSQIGLVDDFLCGTAQECLAGTTRILKRRHLLHLAHSLAGRSLLKTTAADLNAWVERTPPLSAATKRSYLTSLTSFFEMKLTAARTILPMAAT